MTKYAVVIVLTTFALTCLARPSRENDIASLAAAGKWDEVQRLLNDFYKTKLDNNPLSDLDLRSHRPRSGEKFYGESETQFHSASNIGGRIDERSGGHRVINQNGRVTEYDFQPRTSNPFQGALRH